jgi:hypothetical protein
MAGTASNNGTVIPCNGFAVILRCEPLRASKDGVQRRACSYPSRRARKSAHLRANAIAFVPGKTLRFAETTMLILLLGQITRYCVQPLLQKYFVLRLTQISCLFRISRALEEGRFAIVTNVGAGSGGRGCAFDEQRVKRTAKSCGPDAPMAGVKFAMIVRITRATMTNKLWSRRGEHGISRRTIAQGRPDCFR